MPKNKNHRDMKTLTLTIILLTNTFVGLGQNLISNWTFANGLTLNCQYWYDGCGNISCDTTMYCQVTFINDPTIPTFLDSWVLQLDAGFPQVGFAETYITGQSGTKVYQFKYYMKSDTTLQGDNSTGYASLGIGTQNQFTASKTLSDTTSVWKQFTFTDTLTTQTSDTITVRLSAGICDYCINRVYFDYIELTVTDTLTSIDHIDQFDNEKVKIYPNPSTENFMIEFTDGKNENRTLTIYNSTGQLIKTIKTNKNIVTIDNEHITSGLYFYQIQRATDKRLIGQGKFIIQ